MEGLLFERNENVANQIESKLIVPVFRCFHSCVLFRYDTRDRSITNDKLIIDYATMNSEHKTMDSIYITNSKPFRFISCHFVSFQFLINSEWYLKNHSELKALNPNFPLLMRTAENCMPAVTTELEWTQDHLLQFMIQTNRFRNANGTIADDRVDAAREYLQTDWEKFATARLAHKGFDPQQPSVQQQSNNNSSWRDDASLEAALSEYSSMKSNMDDQMNVIRSGPNKEYTRGVNALLMAQRVDLWCSGEKEVELAVQHLYKLGRLLNEREPVFPKHIKDFYPGVEDI